MKTRQLESKSGWFVGGGIVASILASLCCIGPLVLTLLGVSGAAALSKFEFLRTPMIGLVFVLFGVSGYLLFRRRTSCEPGSVCADPKKYRMMVIFYGVGLALAVLAVSSPVWIARVF